MLSISEILELYEKSNSGYGVSNEYEFVKISNDSLDTLDSAMIRYARLDEEDSITFVFFENWEEQLLSFYPNSEEYWLGSVPEELELKNLSSKQYLINLLKEFFSPSDFQAYKVDVNKNGYYACSSEEYVFKTNLDIYLLSFQVHD